MGAGGGRAKGCSSSSALWVTPSLRCRHSLAFGRFAFAGVPFFLRCTHLRGFPVRGGRSPAFGELEFVRPLRRRSEPSKGFGARRCGDDEPAWTSRSSFDEHCIFPSFFLPEEIHFSY